MLIQNLEQLEAVYNAPIAKASLVKETDRITPYYEKLIAASPFLTLATCGPEGLDCSPRGDVPGFVRVTGPKTLVMPDRRGNNRIDSLRNIVRDPRVALLFLIPGLGTTLRVNGRATISIDADLLASFTVEGIAPRTAIIIQVDAAYFQCARAIVRSKLWDGERHVNAEALPSTGDMLAALSGGEVGGKAYDDEWPGRALKSLW